MNTSTQYFFTPDHTDINLLILSYVEDRNPPDLKFLSKTLFKLYVSEELWNLKISQQFGDNYLEMKPKKINCHQMYVDLKLQSTGLSYKYQNKPYLYEWAHSNGVKFKTEDSDFAFQSNYHRVIKWLADKNIYPSRKCMNEMTIRICGGKLEILEWLADLPVKWSNNTQCSNKIPIKEYQKKYGHFYVSESSKEYFAKKLKILKWLAQPPRNIYPSEWSIEGIGYGKIVDVNKS